MKTDDTMLKIFLHALQEPKRCNKVCEDVNAETGPVLTSVFAY